MPEIEICSLKTEDIETLSAFEHGYYSQYVWQMNLESVVESIRIEFRRVRLPRRVFVPYPRKREEIFKDLNDAEAFLVAGCKEGLVGYIKLYADKNAKVARITDLVVSGPMRRKGIASGLLIAAMDLITHRHFDTLILEVQSKNDPAIRIASKLGFNFSGFRDQYFPNQELALFFSRFTR